MLGVDIEPRGDFRVNYIIPWTKGRRLATATWFVPESGRERLLGGAFFQAVENNPVIAKVYPHQMHVAYRSSTGSGGYSFEGGEIGRVAVTMSASVDDISGGRLRPDDDNIEFSQPILLTIKEGSLIESARIEDVSQPYTDERWPDAIYTDYTCILTGDFSDYHRVNRYYRRYVEVRSLDGSSSGIYANTNLDKALELVGDDFKLTITHRDTTGSGPFAGDASVTLFLYDGAERDADGLITVGYTYETVRVNLSGR